MTSLSHSVLGAIRTSFAAILIAALPIPIALHAGPAFAAPSIAAPPLAHLQQGPHDLKIADSSDDSDDQTADDSDSGDDQTADDSDDSDDDTAADTGAGSQPTAIYAPGEPIVTGFSGVVPPNPAPTTGDPLDKTLIDLNGNSMVIQQLQPDGPPTGQSIDSPPVFTAKAKDVGQVFGIALDDADVPNIYLGASSAFGLDLVVPDTDGTPIRSKLGATGATFMPGQWGTAAGSTGTPGSIWKVDGTTGKISLFTTIAANTGAGLGNIVFDPSSEQFFVSDLDTGLIYRLDSTGAIVDTFDHGVTARPNHSLAAVADDGSEMDITAAAFNSEDPTTWGFTQAERKVYGLAVHGGRLYYAVAAGPQIWSVGINPDGSFASDARWELDVTGLPSTNEITNIVFDNEGRMILAQRGPQVGSYDYSVFATPKTSSVVRYTREIPDDPATPSIWIETPDTYATGFRPEGQNADGGIALGYGYDPGTQTIGGACSNYLWSTGELLRDASAIDPPLDPPLGPPAQVHGLQGNDHNLVRPQNDPPLLSYFTDYDGNTGDDQAQYQGHLGDVEIWQNCEGEPASAYSPPDLPPPGYVWPPGGNLTLTKWARHEDCEDDNADWVCRFVIRVENTGSSVYWGPVTVDDWLPDDPKGAKMKFWQQPPWDCSKDGSDEYECDYPSTILYPGDSIDLHEKVRLPKKDNTYCYLDNTAAIDWHYGYGDANPGDDQDFASARIPDPKCNPTHDPKTNLRLKKFAHPQDCVFGKGGWHCEFAIEVTNTGPGDYNAPIQVKDTLPFPTPTTSGPPPWSCSTSGATLTCDHPTILLHPGQSVWLHISAIIPNAIDGKQVCKIDNTAQITKAAGGTDLNLDPSDDKDSATANIPSVECNPTRQTTDLSITKAPIGCKLSPSVVAISGEFRCGFKVTVKNEGPANFNGTVVVHDTFTPPVAPADLLTVPPGICVPASGGYDCTLTGVSLTPGQTTSFLIGFKTPQNTKVCDVKNTAQIKSPAGGSITNSNPGNDSASTGIHVPSRACNQGSSDLSLTKTVAQCSLERLLITTAPVCYQVTITNLGPANFNGPIHFTDTFTPVAGGINSQPGLTCTPAGGGTFNCNSSGNVALSVGASVSYHIQSAIDTKGGTVCRDVNSAEITMPLGGSPTNTNPGNDHGSAVYPIPKCGNHPGTLTITKTAGTCSPFVGATVGAWGCSFTITVTASGGPVAGPISVHESAVDSGSPVPMSFDPSGGCVANGGNTYTCTHPGGLASGGSWSFAAHAGLNAVQVRRGDCSVVNTASIVSPGSGTATATDTITGPACGAHPVATDLAITKTADGCTMLRGENYACSFTVTVTNLGNASAKGPIVVHDTPGTGQGAKFGSTPCTISGVGYDCSFPGDLPAHGKITFTSTVPGTITRGVSTSCDAGNGAVISSPVNNASNTLAANDTATATATVNSPDCQEVLKHKPPLCAFIERQPDGTCCPNDWVWNGKRCIPSRNGGTQQCGDNTTGTYPDCTCDTGFHHTTSRTSCVPDTPPNNGGNNGPQCGPNSSGTYPDCACDTGFHRGRIANSCIPDTPANGPQCGAHSSGTYPDCACDTGFHRGRIAHSCVADTPPTTGGKQCGANSSGTYPACTCNTGFHPGRIAHSCIANPPANNGGNNNGQQCGAHSSGTYPDCACDTGYRHLRSRTLCVPAPANNNGGGVIKLNPGVIKALRCGAHSSGEYPDCECNEGYHHTTSRIICVPEVLRLNPETNINPNLTLRQGPALTLPRGGAMRVLR